MSSTVGAAPPRWQMLHSGLGPWIPDEPIAPKPPFEEASAGVERSSQAIPMQRMSTLCWAGPIDSPPHWQVAIVPSTDIVFTALATIEMHRPAERRDEEQSGGG